MKRKLKENGSFRSSDANNSSVRFLVVTMAISLFLLFCVISTNAQNRKPSKKPGKPSKKSLILTPLEPQIPLDLIQNLSVCVPQKKDTLSILVLNSDSNLKLIIQTKDSSKTLIESAPISSLEQVLTKIEKNSTVILRSDPGLTFSTVVDSLYTIRKTLDECVNIEASVNKKESYVYILPEPKPLTNLNVKPNPLTLLVTVKANKYLALNNADEGTLSDLSKIKKHLRSIFQARIDNGVFREGTNEIESTLYVKADRSLPFNQVALLIDALKECGASPIGLIIDTLEQ